MVTITLERQVPEIDYQLGVYRMTCRVVEVSGLIDSSLFLFQLRPQSPYNHQEMADFVGTVGPLEFDLPVDGPDIGQITFRKSEGTLDFPSSSLAEAFWQEIQRSFKILARSIERVQDLSVAENVVITSD